MKEYLNFFKAVPNLSCLGNLVQDGYRVIYENTEIVSETEGKANNYPIFLQATDLETPFIKTDRLFYVHESDWLRYPKGRIKRGELLIEVKGRIEKVALVPDDFSEKALVTGSLYKLTVNQKVNKHYLLAYLICKYGVAFKNRYKTNLLISFLSKDDLHRIPVPIFSTEFQNRIGDIFQKIFEGQKKEKSIYGEAEMRLLETLGMVNYSPSVATVNIKSFKNSFGRTGRLDAEHYQPKYEALYQALAKNNRVFKLGDRLSFNQRGTQPDYADEGLPVVNSKHVQRGQVNMGDTRFANMPDKTNAVVIQQGDVLMNGTGVGTIGRAAPYLHPEKALPDNHVTVLRTDAMSPICLALYLNSIAGQYQVDQHFKGSSGQIELYPADIANFWCPELDKSIQQQIDKLAQQSFKLKSKSERLLEAAKRAVEIAIELDEAAGMAYLALEGALT